MSQKNMNPVEITRIPHRVGIGVRDQFLILGYLVTAITFAKWPGLNDVPKVFALMLLLAFLYNVSVLKRRIYVPTTFIIWGLWFLVALASLLLAEEVRLNKAVQVALFAAVAFVVTNMLIWNRSTGFYVVSLVVAIGVSAVFYVVDPSGPGVGGLLEGDVERSNSHAVALSLGLALSLVMFLGVKNWIQKVLLVGLIVIFFFLVVTQGSRQALLGGAVVAGGIVAVVAVYRAWLAKDASFALSFLAIAAAAPLAVMAVMSSKYWHRFQRVPDALQDPSADGSITGRLWMLERGLELWATSPIIGIGPNNYRFSLDADHFYASTIGTYSHNNYMEVLVGTGLLGFLLFFGIYVLWLGQLYVLRAAVKCRELVVRYTMVLVVVAFVIVIGVFNVQYDDRLFWILLPFVVAELQLLKTERSLKAPRKNPYQ